MNLNDLLKSSRKKADSKRKGTKIEKENLRYPQVRAKKPDSLVLIVHLYHCNNCHSEHRSPNNILLTKFERMMVGFEGPVSYLIGHNEIPRLKREIHVYRSYSAFCEDCFEADEVLDDGRYLDKRWGKNKISPVYFSDDDRLPRSGEEHEVSGNAEEEETYSDDTDPEIRVEALFETTNGVEDEKT